MLIVGCPPIGPNPAAVLQGVWRLIFDNPGDLEGFDIQLTFDSNGQLTDISAVSPQGGTASLDVNNSSTTLEGDDVTISIPTQQGTRTFEGTLSADENSIDGAFSQEIELPSGDLDVSLPDSDATLRRIRDCDGDDDCEDDEVCADEECVEGNCTEAGDCDDQNACTTNACTDNFCVFSTIACTDASTCPAGCNTACTGNVCSN